MGWAPGPFSGTEARSGVSRSDLGFSGVSWLRSSRLQTVSDKEPLDSSFPGECFGVLLFTFENSDTSFLTGVFLSALPNVGFLREEEELSRARGSSPSTGAAVGDYRHTHTRAGRRQVSEGERGFPGISGLPLLLAQTFTRFPLASASARRDALPVPGSLSERLESRWAELAPQCPG